jgi:hypothetical protein
MAGVGLDVSRQEISNIITEARNTGQDEKVYLRAQLIARYPGIENTTIRRNGQVYSVLDYLAEDTESYATGA